MANDSSSTPSALILLHPGFEEMEAIGPIDLLRRAEVNLTLVSTTDGIHVTGKNQVTLHADTTLDALDSREFDMIILPGGPGINGIVDRGDIHHLVRRHAEAGKWVAAICAAPRVLAAAGLLAGKSFTGHHSIAGELPELDPTQAVIVDSPLVTSRGAGTATQFGLKLIELLTSVKQSRAIANSIHWQD